jgi:hypothetical protein
MSDVLAPEEVYELTGYRRPGKQRAHLDAHGIFYVPNRHGHPKVPRSSLGPQAHAELRPASAYDGEGRALLLRLQREAAGVGSARDGQGKGAKAVGGARSRPPRRVDSW